MLDINHIIIGVLIIIVLIIFFTMESQENAGNISPGTANLNTEAIANISSVYSEGLHGTSTFNNINVTGNITGNNINTNKINMNNTGFVFWTQELKGINGLNVEAKDPSGNTYPGDKWVLYAGGWGAYNIGGCTTNIQDNKWHISFWSVHDVGNGAQILAIPRGYFSAVYA